MCCPRTFLRQNDGRSNILARILPRQAPACFNFAAELVMGRQGKLRARQLLPLVAHHFRREDIEIDAK